MKIQVTTSTQSAIPEINREQKTMYYLIIGDGMDKAVINVGEKTYHTVGKLLANEQTALNESKKITK